MNFQTSQNFPTDSVAADGNAVKTALRRLHAALDPGNPAPDLGQARAMVDSLIDLTRANDDAGDLVPAGLNLPGRQGVILKALLRNADGICTKTDLADLCRVSSNSTRVIRVYVCQIRAELAEHGLGDTIESIWGVGYRIWAGDARRIRRLMRRHAGSAEAMETAS